MLQGIASHCSTAELVYCLPSSAKTRGFAPGELLRVQLFLLPTLDCERIHSHAIFLPPLKTLRFIRKPCEILRAADFLHVHERDWIGYVFTLCALLRLKVKGSTELGEIPRAQLFSCLYTKGRMVIQCLHHVLAHRLHGFFPIVSDLGRMSTIYFLPALLFLQFFFLLNLLLFSSFFLSGDLLGHANSTLYAMIGPQWLSEMRRLWPNVP